MKRVCAWCDGDMGETFGPSELTTHGICAKCQDKVSAAIGRRTSVCEIHGRYWPGPSFLDGKPVCPECDREIKEDAFPEEHDGEARAARAEAYGVDR